MMKIIFKSFQVLLFFFVLSSVHGKPDFSYYHTTDRLDQAAQDLLDQCNNQLKYMTISKSPMINLYQISNPKTSGNKLKAFLLFGEHAREMISPELGLNFLRSICQQNQNQNLISKEVLQTVLDNFDIQLILNSNPESRKKVESGEYCLRENENGVDLNRNWDNHWIKGGNQEEQTFSGSAPFSEIESQLAKQYLEKFNPTLFLTVHSGTLGIYIPYAYTNSEGTFNHDNMKQILNDINKKYCNCQAGSAGREVGYLSPGTCLDFAYDNLKIPYVYAWEIYDKDSDIKKKYTNMRANILYQNLRFISMAEKNKKKFSYDNRFSCFLQNKAQMQTMSNEQCFEFFNPINYELYQLTLNNWTQAIFDMLSQTYNLEKNKINK